MSSKYITPKFIITLLRKLVQELLVNKNLNLGKMHQGKKRVKKDAPDETLSDRFKYFN